MYFAHIKNRIDVLLWEFSLKSGLDINHSWSVFWFILFSPYILTMALWSSLAESPMAKMLLLFITGVMAVGVLYLFLILGAPDQKKWEEIFTHYVDRVSVLVRDRSGDVIGKYDNPKLKNREKSALYPDYLPPFYIDMLLYREEKLLSFDNNHTGIQGLLANPRSFNGLDAVGMPLAIVKSALKGKPRGGSSLSQQLVKKYYGTKSFSSTLHRKYKEITEAKVFYHNLKANNGAEFKRFVSISTPVLVVKHSGTQHGIKTGAMMIFGKRLEKLEKFEQALLSRMHLNNFYFHIPKQCKRIKNGTLVDLDAYFSNQTDKSELPKLKEEVRNWGCPTSPKIPTDFQARFAQLSNKEQIAYGSLDKRLQILASSSSTLLKNELISYRAKHPNRLLIETKLTIDSAKNITFKSSVKNRLTKLEKKLSRKLDADLDGQNMLPNEKKANIFMSVVNDKGEIVRLYRQGNTAYPRRIGSTSKVFAAIALGLRGDKPHTLYWNQPYKGLHNSNGSQGGPLSKSHVFSAAHVFGASKNLPVRSALYGWVSQQADIHLVKNPISQKTLTQIYDSFNLRRDDHIIALPYEMAFGLTNAKPLGLQASIHKLTHILYGHGKYAKAHIIQSLQYKKVKNQKILNRTYSTHNIYAQTIDAKTQALFTSSSKAYIKSVLKAALSPHYGTLRSFRNVKGFRQLFMKSGTTDVVNKGTKLTQSKWTVGAIRVQGKNYSFVIMVEHEQGLGKKLKHTEVSKALFREIVGSLR